MRRMLMPTLVRLVLIMYVGVFIVPVLPAQQKKPVQPKKLNIAVLDFDSRGGITKEEAASLSDIFQAQLVQMGEFIVVDRNRIKAILQEQGFQQSEACSQVECIVDVGRILKVEKMFAGTIGKVGKIFNVNIQLIDIATAQIISNKGQQHSGALEDLATDIIPNLAQEMAQEMTGKDVRARVSSSGGGMPWYLYAGGAVLVGGVAAVVLLGGDGGGGGGTTTTNPLPGGPVFP
jgi:TolB-like protein